jgi:hypothetical protein
MLINGSWVSVGDRLPDKPLDNTPTDGVPVSPVQGDFTDPRSNGNRIVSLAAQHDKKPGK